MENLLNISNLALTYGISVRTLRYYEDRGLITSIRESETTSRFYEESQVERLQQILLLRKLNISIKDIKTIFESNESATFLSILDNKVNDVDMEIAELYQLKKYINTFLEQLKALTSSNEMTTKRLLEEINTFEMEITSEKEYEPAPAENLSLSQPTAKVDIRLISLPACQMVSSGYGYYGQPNFDFFDKWFSKFPIDPLSMPKDFLWYDPIKNASVWWYIYSPELDTCGLSIESFEGGMYASAISKDADDEDGNRVYQAILKWLADHEIFELNEYPGHYTMCHVITPPEIQEIWGHSQLEILVPIRKKQQ